MQLAPLFHFFKSSNKELHFLKIRNYKFIIQYMFKINVEAEYIQHKV